MFPIAVFIGMLEFVEGIVLRVEQLPVAPHETLVEHWVFHGHPRVAAGPDRVGFGFEPRYGGTTPGARPNEEVVTMSTATVSSDSTRDRVELGTVAVIAHSGKTLGGGLRELRDELLTAGIAEPLWFEVPKSKRAPKCVRRALDSGADLLLVWGGDGMVQRCADAAAGSDAALAVIPAGTANLFASNLGIPNDLRGAVEIALHGRRRRFDLGRVNGEHFAVMAGAGVDALMIRDADGALKRRLGRFAYIVTGAKSIAMGRIPTRIKVDGAKWFDGKARSVSMSSPTAR